jgi:hypothetical protein
MIFFEKSDQMAPIQPQNQKKSSFLQNFYSIDIVQTIVIFLRIENLFCAQSAIQSTYKFNKNERSQEQLRNKNLY